VELLYLISGTLDLTIGSELIRLEPGDSVYFDSSVRHSYHRASKAACAALIVTS
jgi:mannose-6-phosphate isomerase-like protein (cupin superfamily)